jgi:hypothetical protein
VLDRRAAEQNAAIEERAVLVTREHFENELGYETEDVGTRESYPGPGRRNQEKSSRPRLQPPSGGACPGSMRSEGEVAGSPLRRHSATVVQQFHSVIITCDSMCESSILTRLFKRAALSQCVPSVACVVTSPRWITLSRVANALITS